MDLALYLRVLWRFRLLVLIGLCLAFALMFLSMVRVSFGGASPTFTYREAEQWASDTTLLVTERGFPLGRSILDDVVPAKTADGKLATTGSVEGVLPGLSYVPRYGDPGRFANLAIVYSQLATSDQVFRMVQPRGRIPGLIKAQAMINEETGGTLPVVLIRAISTSPGQAVDLADRTSEALRAFIKREQVENRIAQDRRVELSYMKRAQRPVLMVPRSKTRPIFIFLAVLVATMGLAFLLENLRPQIRSVAAEEPPSVHKPERDTSRRRSA